MRLIIVSRHKNSYFKHLGIELIPQIQKLDWRLLCSLQSFFI